VLSVRLADHPLTQVAQDGVFLPAPTDRDRVVLAPGNRVDVLVRHDRTGRYALVTDPYDRGSISMMGGSLGPARASGPITLATLAVEGPAQPSPLLPATLPAPPAPQGPVDGRRQLTFAMGMGGMGMRGMGMRFTIDGRTFDHQRDDQTVRLGSTEDW
jgi:FtsP/CotA-like multicopper oxidase with cupredoxin domain